MGYCHRYAALGPLNQFGRFKLPSQASKWCWRNTTITLRASLRRHYQASTIQDDHIAGTGSETTPSRLNPAPDDYGRQIFADKCRVKVRGGAGGNGCVSFLRDKFIAEGPPNGGDGGTGGNIYIQAVSGETSLHKIARQRSIQAGRGRNGQGKSKGGQRGEDVFIRVPVGTVVREVSRFDPVAEDAASRKAKQESKVGGDFDISDHRKWIIYPKATGEDLAGQKRPSMPRWRSDLGAPRTEAPIFLDLSKPMENPRLLVAGARGGLGNPHFVSRTNPRPQFATKGDAGIRVELELELKILADLGFVGFPNAGKSTLLRALSRSRARVGDWAFTTLQPNIGTVVLDDDHGPARIHAVDSDGHRRSKLSIADIPGIIPDAHLDRGLGLDFLRHIERARVLAFVVDLSSGDAVAVLKSLWKELAAFEEAKKRPGRDSSDVEIIDWHRFGQSPAIASANKAPDSHIIPPEMHKLQLPPISTKPWFVVGTKSDVDGTQANFEHLRAYLAAVGRGRDEHPAGNGAVERWSGPITLVPISAIRGHGVDAISRTTVKLLGA